MGPPWPGGSGLSHLAGITFPGSVNPHLFVFVFNTPKYSGFKNFWMNSLHDHTNLKRQLSSHYRGPALNQKKPSFLLCLQVQKGQSLELLWPSGTKGSSHRGWGSPELWSRRELLGIWSTCQELAE